MPTRGLLSLCLVSLVACSGSSTPPAQPKAPDLAVIEQCPPKPRPEDAQRGKDRKDPLSPMEAALPPTVLQGRRDALQNKLPQVCDSLLADLKHGKPLPTKPVALDEASELGLDDATAAATLRKTVTMVTTCRAIATGSKAACSTLAADARAKCLADWSAHDDAHRAPGARFSQADIDACKAREKPERCEAYKAALVGNAPDKCPPNSGDCVARASLDPSKCPTGADHDVCVEHVARDRVAAGKPAGNEATKIAVHDPADDCGHVDEWFGSSCRDPKLVRTRAASPATHTP